MADAGSGAEGSGGPRAVYAHFHFGAGSYKSSMLADSARDALQELVARGLAVASNGMGCGLLTVPVGGDPPAPSRRACTMR